MFLRKRQEVQGVLPHGERGSGAVHPGPPEYNVRRRQPAPVRRVTSSEQIVAGTAPADYTDPAQFFSRTYFTRALTQHAGMVLRRLSGETANTAPVLTLITQFGGGKTHTLTSLYPWGGKTSCGPPILMMQTS